MEQYHKRLKKYYKSKNKKMNKNKHSKNYFDSLFIRIFLSSLIVLIVVLFTNLTSIRFDFLTKPLNLTKIGVNLISFFDDEKLKETILSTSTDYEEFTFDGKNNIFHSRSTNFVKCLKAGTVIKINKKESLYTITIQTYDGMIYEYLGLLSIDCYLYEYIDIDQIIGTPQIINNVSTFNLIISKDNKYYEYR